MRFLECRLRRCVWGVEEGNKARGKAGKQRAESRVQENKKAGT